MHAAQIVFEYFMVPSPLDRSTARVIIQQRTATGDLYYHLSRYVQDGMGGKVDQEVMLT